MRRALAFGLFAFVSVGKGVLEVVTERGPRRFVDAPGARWRYCGYDAQAKAHLIGKDDDSTGAGELLLQETGAQLHAGHTVVFAPDRKAFLAIEQEGGEDGEHWTVPGTDGKPIWSGYAGVVAKVDGGTSHRRSLYVM